MALDQPRLMDSLIESLARLPRVAILSSGSSEARPVFAANTQPAGLNGEPRAVTVHPSGGATIRFNAFGFAVGEIDYVRPLDRPGRGWIWQFNLIPGF